MDEDDRDSEEQDEVLSDFFDDKNKPTIEQAGAFSLKRTLSLKKYKSSFGGLSNKMSLKSSKSNDLIDDLEKGSMSLSKQKSFAVGRPRIPSL